MEQDIVFNAGTISEALNNKVDLPTNPERAQDQIDYVVDWQVPTAENSYTWYRKYKSGWIRQGGYLNAGSSNTFTVTLPVEMSNDNYHVMGTLRATSHSGGGCSVANVYIISSTQIGIVQDYSGGWTGTGTYWEVEGFAA